MRALSLLCVLFVLGCARRSDRVPVTAIDSSPEVTIGSVWTEQCGRYGLDPGLNGLQETHAISKRVHLDDCGPDQEYSVEYDPDDVNIDDVCVAPCEHKSLRNGLYTWILARKELGKPPELSFVQCTNAWEFGSKHQQLSMVNAKDGVYVLAAGEAAVEDSTFTWNLLSGTFTLRNIEAKTYTAEQIEGIMEHVFSSWLPRGIKSTLTKETLLPDLSEASLKDWIALCDSKHELWISRKRFMVPGGENSGTVCPSYQLASLGDLSALQLKMVLCPDKWDGRFKKLHFPVQTPKPLTLFQTYDDNVELNFVPTSLLISYDIKSRVSTSDTTIGGITRLDLSNENTQLRFDAVCYTRFFGSNGPAECLSITGGMTEEKEVSESRKAKRKFGRKGTYTYTVKVKKWMPVTSSVMLRMSAEQKARLKEYLGFLHKEAA